MLIKFRKWFRRWNQLGCPKCGCKQVHMANESYLDSHILCEFTERCDKCNEVVNIWAYGSYMPPVTKTDLLSMKLIAIKLFFINWWETKY